MASSEIWKKINNYSNYEVSNYGRIRSKYKILKPQITKKGYLRVSLYNDNGIKMGSVHRLVAQAFIPNNNNLPQINHIDGNKLNNYISNLEWCDNKYNQLHAIKLGLNHNSKKIYQYTKNNLFIKSWESITKASKCLNIDNSHIGQVCNGKRKTAGGYIWKYGVIV